MILFRFLTGKPWIYLIFGLALLALTVYSIFDVRKGGNIIPFEQLEVYKGQVVAVREASEGYIAKMADGSQLKVNHLAFDLRAPNAETSTWRVLVTQPLTEGAQVRLYANQGKGAKVYHLVADGHVLVDYNDLAGLALAKAVKANNDLTSPIVLAFTGVMLFGGGFAQFRIWQKRRRMILAGETIVTKSSHILLDDTIYKP